MADLEIRLRIRAANDEARRLGYRIQPTFDPNSGHTAIAHLLDAETTEGGHFLCRRSSALEALEDGVEVLCRVVELHKPWPGPP
jgi:hypothetical protein